MSPRLAAEFVLLAALWGASFLFMRQAALAFGPELIWATAADSAQIAASELGVRRRLCCP